MAEKSNKQKTKPQLFFLFSFLPFLQFVPFFVMNGRLPKKKWLICGFVYIFLLILGVVLPIMGESWYEARLNRPEMNSYLPGYYDMSVEEYQKTPEYAAYTADLRAYEDTTLPALRRVKNGTQTAGTCILLLTVILTCVILFFVERYSFIKELQAMDSKAQIYSELANRQETAAPVSEQPAVSPPSQAVQRAPFTPVRINEATEKELLSLPGLNVIDVKKILSLRDQSGFFATAEEFFAAIDAKPHVIARLQEKILVKKPPENTSGTSNTSVNRFDL